MTAAVDLRYTYTVNCVRAERDLSLVSVACTMILRTRRMPDDAFDALTAGPVGAEQTWRSRRTVDDWLKVES